MGIKWSDMIIASITATEVVTNFAPHQRKSSHSGIGLGCCPEESGGLSLLVKFAHNFFCPRHKPNSSR